MHGCGNDFVMVNCLGDFGDEIARTARENAVRICDRRFGVGGDGVVAVTDGESHRFRMRIYNADGSEAEMCGNAVRCFAKLVHDHGWTQGATEFKLEAGAGVLSMVCTLDAAGRVDRVRVDMGAPILAPAGVPTTLGTGPHPVVDYLLDIGDRVLPVTAVSMGNPHAVTFVEDVASYPVEAVGRRVEHHPAFPNRTNTEFVQVLSGDEVNFRVWERGVGETLACGTGACAAVVAGALTGRTGRRVTVHLPGGDLDIDWSEDDNHVYMTGPAIEVFEGEIVC